MATQNNDHVELTAQCLCKRHTFTTQVPSSSLPLSASFCHCNSCRHSTGSLYTSSLQWPGPVDDIHKDTTPLAVYKFSDNVSILFCEKCSTAMFAREVREGSDDFYAVPTGVLGNNAVPGLIQFKDHIFVSDTVDGGAAVWLQHITTGDKGEPLPCYAEWRGKSDVVDPVEMAAAASKKQEGQNLPDEIPLYCHCKGVNLVLRRGKADYAGKEKLPFFVEPDTFKLLGSFDACDSCRIPVGSEFMYWTFQLLKYIDFANASSESPFPDSSISLKAAVSDPNRDPRFGTLTYYASSPDVQRYFCSKCSACVFYAVDDRPEMVDVSIGLLDAPDGARAEGYLAWVLGMLTWADDMKGGWREQIAEETKNGAENWRVKTGQGISWVRAAREKKAAEAAAAKKI